MNFIFKNIQNIYGYSVLHSSIYHRNIQISNYIHEKYPNIINSHGNLYNCPYALIACSYDDMNMIKWLYSINPDLFFEKSSHGQSAISYCVYYDNIKIIKFLYYSNKSLLYSGFSPLSFLYNVLLCDAYEIFTFIYTKDANYINSECETNDDIKSLMSSEYQLNNTISNMKSLMYLNNFKIMSCPICRSYITNAIKIYYTFTDTCSVCLDNIKQPYVLNCGHIFCKQCILKH